MIRQEERKEEREAMPAPQERPGNQIFTKKS